MFCRTRREEKAFTLVELLAVLAVTGTLLLIVLPSVLGVLSGRSLYAAAHQMAADIRAWQQRALAEQPELYTCEVQFNVTGEAYLLMYGNTVLESRRLPVYLDLEATNFSNQVLRFNARGAPLAGGTVTLREKLTGKRYYVIVAPVTGRVRVSPSPPSGWDDY